MRAHVLLVALVTACALPALARAQDDDPSRAAAARALFQEGVELARRESYADAADRFRRAYALRPAPSIAFNLASALTHQGRLVEASETLARLLRDPALDEDMRAAIGVQQAAIAPRLARLSVRLDGDASGATVSLDGRELPAEALGIALPTDPGAHEAIATRGGETVARERTELGEGARGELVLHVPAPVVAPAAIEAPRAAPSEPVAQGGGDDVWIWIGIGAGVIVVGAAVTAAVLLAPGSSEPTPISGNTMPGVITW